MPTHTHLRVLRARLDTKLCVPMASRMRRRLEEEARAAGYRSVSGYVRDIYLSVPPSRRALLDRMTARADADGGDD